MRKQVVVLAISTLAILGIVLYGIQYVRLFDPEIQAGEIIVVTEDIVDNSETDQQEPVSYIIESVATDLFVPWSIVFPSEDRLLVSERRGQIREIINGVVTPEPLHIFPEVSSIAEEGLMGLALDPDYLTNQLLYACLAYDAGGALQVRVIRLKDRGTIIDRDGIVIDTIPAARFHAGCRLGFGPDDKLYITTGDATEKQIAQDLNSLGGKILRINTDGSVPTDNPFEGSYIYSYGHRNAQGIDWHPESNVLLSTEHGPSIFDGPAGGDEINRIIAGGNYGWPLVSHDNTAPGLIDPLIQFTPATAPASAMVYSGRVFPQWKGNLFYGGLRGEGVYRIAFTDAKATSVATVERLPEQFGRIRDIVEGPDGLIYFSTSNRGGRGTIQQGDDHIYRIVPKQLSE